MSTKTDNPTMAERINTFAGELAELNEITLRRRTLLMAALSDADFMALRESDGDMIRALAELRERALDLAAHCSIQRRKIAQREAAIVGGLGGN